MPATMTKHASNSADTGPVTDMMRLAGTKRIGWLAILSVIAALTEGFGFALLVPLLAGLAGGTPDILGPGLARVLIGVPPASWLVLFAALVTLRAVAEYWRSLAAHDLSAAIVDGLRARATAALLAAEWRALSGMRQSANRALLITTIDRVGDALDAGFNLLRASATLAAIAIAAFVISPLAALVAGSLGIAVLLAYTGLRRRARMLGADVSRGYERIYAGLEETLGALRLIKSYGKEASAQSAITGSFTELRQTQRNYLQLTGRARVVFTILAAASLGLLVWLATSRWEMSFAILVPLVAILARGVGQFSFLQDNWQVWAHHGPALTEARDLIADIEANAELSASGGGTSEPFGVKQAISLSGVRVHFRGARPVLDGVDLVLPAGSCTALGGPSGGGKSTLADLLGGLISPDSGDLEIDGTALGSAGRNLWRRSVAYVQQEPVLFNGSVADNLRWANEGASDAEMSEALERSSARFVFDLPGGMNCQLGEGGRHLSGGERQRIALARALIRRPQLLILDEATSALDAASDEAIARALIGLKGTLTMLIISHRGALSQIADRKLELSGGKITDIRS